MATDDLNSNPDFLWTAEDARKESAKGANLVKPRNEFLARIQVLMTTAAANGKYETCIRVEDEFFPVLDAARTTLARVGHTSRSHPGVGPAVTDDEYAAIRFLTVSWNRPKEDLNDWNSK
jgi:hypothetical protein